MNDALRRSRLASLVTRGGYRGGRLTREIAFRVLYPFASRDEARARWAYLRFHGVEPNLSSPRGLDEKLCWLKVHDRRPLLTRMSCKLEAREVVRERGFGHLLKELYNSWERAEDIEFDTLPDQFALKATHGSNMNYFHLGGRVRDCDAIIEMARRWLKTDYASIFGEWGYRNIKPRLLAEELLPLTTSLGLPELRVWCFGGEPRFIRRLSGFSGTIPQQVSVRPKGLHLDLDWNPLPFHYKTRESAELPARPGYLDELLAAARALSHDMPVVRVDFSDSGGRLYFGELTLYPFGGLNPWDPPETDLILGDMVDLPDPASLR